MGTSQCTNAAVAQSVERRIGSAEVTGPIPVSSFCRAEKKAFRGRVALRRAFRCEMGNPWRNNYEFENDRD